MAKPIPTTKPTRKPKNNTKHQRGDKNGLKLTGPVEKPTSDKYNAIAARIGTVKPIVTSLPAPCPAVSPFLKANTALRNTTAAAAGTATGSNETITGSGLSGQYTEDSMSWKVSNTINRIDVKRGYNSSRP
jgi:hypothetical protein